MTCNLLDVSTQHNSRVLLEPEDCRARMLEFSVSLVKGNFSPRFFQKSWERKLFLKSFQKIQKKWWGKKTLTSFKCVTELRNINTVGSHSSSMIWAWIFLINQTLSWESNPQCCCSAIDTLYSCCTILPCNFYCLDVLLQIYCTSSIIQSSH